jgi:hypothetical protein
MRSLKNLTQIFSKSSYDPRRRYEAHRRRHIKKISLRVLFEIFRRSSNKFFLRSSCFRNRFQTGFRFSKPVSSFQNRFQTGFRFSKPVSNRFSVFETSCQTSFQNRFQNRFQTGFKFSKPCLLSFLIGLRIFRVNIYQTQLEFQLDFRPYF